MRSNRLLGWLLAVLGVVVAALALMGPLVLDVIHYRTSETTLNQISGGDAAALVLVAPVCTIRVGSLGSVARVLVRSSR